MYLLLADYFSSCQVVPQLQSRITYSRRLDDDTTGSIEVMTCEYGSCARCTKCGDKHMPVSV